MTINTIEAFEYRGKIFTDRAKAVDYAETLISELIKSALIDRGMTVREWVSVTEVIIEKREVLIDLLGY